VHIKQEHPIPTIKLEDDVNETRTNNCFLTICTKEEGSTYSDLCGRYPVKSSRGNQYILVCYDYDSNAILVAEPIQTRAAANMINAFKTMLDNLLTTAGAPPKFHIMDNEASNLLKHALFKRKIKYQLVPPHIHRINMVERAIQTFKAHFIAGLCTTDPKFPAREWDCLLPQAVLTLNHLRNSRINSKLSSHAALFGTFEFKKTPLASPGTRVLSMKMQIIN